VDQGVFVYASPYRSQNFVRDDGRPDTHAWTGLSVEPHDRIGGSVKSFRRRLIGRIIAGSLLIASGWATFEHRDRVMEWAEVGQAYITGAIALIGPRTTATALPQPAESVVEPRPDVQSTELTPGREIETVSEPPAEAAPPVEERLPPPAVAPNNPLQTRAASIGLHPGISAALLGRMSDGDFRNAAYAIATALAETPDTATFVWPARRKPDHALFTVKFVSGAPPECRRYVVTVTKDNWLTTALPMEHCRAKSGQSTSDADTLKPLPKATATACRSQGTCTKL
jgi:surface antigen